MARPFLPRDPSGGFQLPRYLDVSPDDGFWWRVLAGLVFVFARERTLALADRRLIHHWRWRSHTTETELLARILHSKAWPVEVRDGKTLQWERRRLKKREIVSFLAEIRGTEAYRLLEDRARKQVDYLASPDTNPEDARRVVRRWLRKQSLLEDQPTRSSCEVDVGQT